MKVIFVGIHNKPNTPVLCSSTKSGKLIDRIIKELNFDSLKTNLYNVEYLPKDLAEKEKLALDWHSRVNYGHDLIVLLGGEVSKHFNHEPYLDTIKLAHPSSIWSNAKKQEYVDNAVSLILKTVQ